MSRIALPLALPAAAAAVAFFASGALSAGLLCAGLAGACIAVHAGRVRAEERRLRHRFWTGLRAAVTRSDLEVERTTTARN